MKRGEKANKKKVMINFANNKNTGQYSNELEVSEATNSKNSFV